MYEDEVSSSRLSYGSKQLGPTVHDIGNGVSTSRAFSSKAAARNAMDSGIMLANC